MNASGLDRLQEDLNTIRTVTGDDLPFDRWDASWTLATGCAAVLPAVVGLAGVKAVWALLLAATPFVATVLVGLVRNYRAAHPSQHCPYEKRREYRIGVPLMLVVVPLLFGFRIWATNAGAPVVVANACILLCLGLLLIIEGLYNSRRKAAILPGIAAIAAGCMWPYCDRHQFWVLIWSGVAIAVIGASMIMFRQLAVRVQTNDSPN